MVEKTKNLKHFTSNQSREEAVKNGRKGGIKSGEVRRERKALKEELLYLLEQGNTQEKVSLALIKQALKGNVKAFEIIRDTIGEKPTDKQEITGANGEPLGIKKIYVTPEQQKEIKEHIQKMINDR